MNCIAVVVFWFVASVAATAEWKPSLDAAVIYQNHQDCVRESGLRFSLEEGNVATSLDKEVLDYVLCTVKKIGIFTEDRGYDVDRAMALIDGAMPDKAIGRAIVRKCADSNEERSSPAEWAARGIRCLLKAKLE